MEQEIHIGEYKIVRLLQSGTKLFAVNDKGKDVEGVVEAYRFVEYTRPDGSTSHDVEYRIKWLEEDELEWIPWRECNFYSPQRPKRPSNFQPKEEVKV